MREWTGVSTCRRCEGAVFAHLRVRPEQLGQALDAARLQDGVRLRVVARHVEQRAGRDDSGLGAKAAVELAHQDGERVGVPALQPQSLRVTATSSQTLNHLYKTPHYCKPQIRPRHERWRGIRLRVLLEKRPDEGAHLKFQETAAAAPPDLLAGLRHVRQVAEHAERVHTGVLLPLVTHLLGARRAGSDTA